MSVKTLRKALEQKSKTLAELNKQCRHTWRVCKDCMAHCEFKDTEQFKGKWVSLEDVEAFLVELFLEKVIVPRKQLSELIKQCPLVPTLYNMTLYNMTLLERSRLLAEHSVALDEWYHNLKKELLEAQK